MVTNSHEMETEQCRNCGSADTSTIEDASLDVTWLLCNNCKKWYKAGAEGGYACGLQDGGDGTGQDENMTMNPIPALYVYSPDGDVLIAGESVMEDTHIPRKGELLRTTDHSDEGAESVTFADGLRVSEVETEFRLVDNIGRGQSWQQLVSVHTTEVRSEGGEDDA